MQLVYMKQDGYSLSDSTVLLLLVTALYKLAFLLLALILFCWHWPLVRGLIQEMRFLFVLGLTLHVLLIVGLVLLLFSKRMIFWLATGILKVLGKWHLIREPERKVIFLARKSVQYGRCSGFMASHPLLVLRTFGVLMLQRLSLLIIPYLVYRSFGLVGYGPSHMLAIQLLLSLCVDMLPLPGAVGASERVFLILFGPVFGEALLPSAVLLSRGISFYLMVLLSGLVLCGIQLGQIARKRRHIEEGKGSSK